jgi:chemotaxis signal transduction protein
MNPLLNDSMQGKDAAQLRQAFDLSFALSPSQVSLEFEDLLMIRVAGEPYAIRLLDITEILRDRSVVSVPAATPDLLGLAGVHGGIVPVFCLSSILGYGPDSGSPRWIILCGSEEPIALAFSNFEGYLRLPSSALHADDEFRAAHEHVNYVSQVAVTSDGVRAVISIALILASIRKQISPHRPTKES